MLNFKVKQVIYESNNDNIKRPNPQEILLRILKIYTFYQKIQQRASGPGESTAELRSICLRKHNQKLSNSKKGAVGI